MFRRAGFERQAGEAGHEVELGRPCEPQLRVYEADAVLGDPHLRRVEPLLVRVEHARVEAHPIEGSLLHRKMLAGFDARGVGHERVDHEASARLQMRGDVAEAMQLRFLRVELEERVEHHEHEREITLDRHVGHLADRDGNGVATRFGPHALDHRR